MSRPRDSQFSKFWDATLATFGNVPPEDWTIEECKVFFCQVTDKMSKHWRVPELVEWQDGRGRRHAGVWWEDFAYGEAVVTVPRHERSKWRLLTLVAYLTIYENEPWHGWHFCNHYLELVRRFIGADEFRALRNEFKARRVRYNEPKKREMTDDQREAARERMQRLHLRRELQSGEWDVGERLERMLDQ